MQYKNDNTTFYRSSVVSVAHGLKFDATGILNCEKLNLRLPEGMGRRL